MSEKSVMSEPAFGAFTRRALTAPGTLAELHVPKRQGCPAGDEGEEPGMGFPIPIREYESDCGRNDPVSGRIASCRARPRSFPLTAPIVWPLTAALTRIALFWVKFCIAVPPAVTRST